ncbi:Ig domain-containing protein [Comamonas serinivorans]|uniref:Ig domain-containing protein n=1 Tax=Comamonas serinivorans TaxID=1082851 RepID=UPI001F304822|nr:Ig domain-containing protein [Comamonas serinivorans]
MAVASATAAAVLVGCGGGGGSSGSTTLEYSIELTAARTTLPINIANELAGIGAYAPYTTTLYVSAKEGNDAIVNTEGAFSCNVSSGLDTGALYYLDGDEDHEDDETGLPLAYRNISLDSNSGGASFHFHAGDQAGTAVISCSITDPRDNRVKTATQTITVGAATGKPASVQTTVAAPSYLGSQYNVNNIRNNIGLQARVHDDANQSVPNPAAANLQVSIRPTPGNDAYIGARLLSGSQSGSVVQLSTLAGMGQISLSSGPNSGAILLEMTTDRADNNVANGIQDPITQLLVVPVVDVIASEPLALPEELPELAAANGSPFAYAMTAEGGVPPYTWSAVGLPAGLTMSANGLISGTPNATAGTYAFVVTVTDATGVTVTANLSFVISGQTSLERALSLNCGTGTTCTLPGGTAGEPYTYVFSASSATPSTPITWSFSGLPARGLTGNAATGTVSGTPTESVNESCQPISFQVTATQGMQSLTRVVTIPLVCPQPPEPTPAPAPAA